MRKKLMSILVSGMMVLGLVAPAQSYAYQLGNQAKTIDNPKAASIADVTTKVGLSVGATTHVTLKVGETQDISVTYKDKDGKETFGNDVKKLSVDLFYENDSDKPTAGDVVSIVDPTTITSLRIKAERVGKVRVWATATTVNGEEVSTDMDHKVLVEVVPASTTGSTSGGSGGSSGGGGGTYSNKPETEDTTPANTDNITTTSVNDGSYNPSRYSISRFTDVNPNSWQAAPISFVLQHRLMDGTSESTFSPNLVTTRAMMARVLYNLDSKPRADAISSFTDVPRSAWYATAVDWAVGAGITSGMTDTTFAPNASLTREQMVTMLYRFAQSKGMVKANSAQLNFSDANKVSPFAKEAVAWATANGLVQGMGDGTFAPQGESTRAQMAVVLQNMYNMMNK